LLQASPPRGSGRAALGTASWRELQPPVGPGAQAVPMHKAGLGVDRGGSEASPHRVCALARDAAARRHTGGALGVIWRVPLAQSGAGMGESVKRGACQPRLRQEVDGFVQSACAVFEVSGGSAPLGDEAAEPRGHRVARPGIRHRDPKTVGTVQSEGARRACLVMGLTGHNGQPLPRAQPKAEVDPPDEARRQRRLAQRPALEATGRFEAAERASYPPMDDGLRARCVREATSPREATQDARDGAPPAPRPSKALQGQEDHVHLGSGDTLLQWARALTQTRLGRVEGSGGAVPLRGEASELWAWVSVSVASLLGLVLPWLSPVCDGGELAQHAGADPPHGLRP